MRGPRDGLAGETVSAVSGPTLLHEMGDTSVMRFISKIAGAIATVIENTGPNSDISWSQTDRGDETILEVYGDIDLSTVPRLREPLTGGMADRPFILDLQGVDFMDS